MGATRSDRWLPSLAIVAAAVVVVFASILVIQDRNDRSDELAAVQRSCERWATTDAQGDGSVAACRDMVDWMDRQGARGGMGPGMMMSDPSEVREQCRRWMADASASDGSTLPATADWCDRMSERMGAHMDGRAPGRMRDGGRSSDG